MAWVMVANAYHRVLLADHQYQGILAGLSISANLLFLRETRGDVLLSRRARRLTKLTGKRHCCASDLQKKSFINILRVSLVRPFGTLFVSTISQVLSAGELGD